MEFKFKFETEEEKVELIKNKNNEGLFLIEVQYLFEGNYLIFSDKEVVHEPTEIEILANKISILEAENETLKQELSITQDAVNELIFNSLNM